MKGSKNRFKQVAIAATLTMLLGLANIAVAEEVWIHQVSINNDTTLRSWMIKNNTNHTLTVRLKNWGTQNGVDFSNDDFQVTVGAGEDKWLGYVTWTGDHYGHQAFTFGFPAGVSQPTSPSPPSPPAPPVHRPDEPTGFSDERFRFLGIMQFSRTPNQGGWTQQMSLPVHVGPGMKIDNDYHEYNEQRGVGFHCCEGGATSPMTVNNVPAGFYIEVGGREYYSVRDATVTASPFGPVAWGDFIITLYCGPPWNTGCEVNVKVWVVEKRLPN
jgi:hypothetical protein